MADTTSMPTQVGRYRVRKHLGTNELVEIYLGEDTDPSYKGDRVSIKRLRPELQAKDPLYVRGFVAEGEVGRHINHPNVAQIYDTIVQDGVPYLIGEYVDGISLTELASGAGGRIEPAVLAEIARQLCEGLAAIHEAKDDDGTPLNIVHQSIRPSNVAINKRGDVKLLDLGVTRSRIQGRGGVKVEFESSVYLSPEQLRGDVLSPASDQYAVGVLVFESLCGIPFLSALEALATLAEKRAAIDGQLLSDQDRSLDRLDDVLEQEAREGTVPFLSPPPPAEPERSDWARRELPGHLQELEELPEGGLDEILVRMLAYDPADRYASIRDAGADLLRWAWGTGHAIDFRRYVADVIAEYRGEEPLEEEEKPLDEQAIQEAAESSLVPKSIVLGVGAADSAFVPPPKDAVPQPSRPAAPINLAAPSFAQETPAPPPGMLLDEETTGDLPPAAQPTPAAEPEISKQRPLPLRQIGIIAGGIAALLVVVAGLYVFRDSFGFGTAPEPTNAPGPVTQSVATKSSIEGPQKTNDMRELLSAEEHASPPPAAPPAHLAGFRGIRPAEPGEASASPPPVKPDTAFLDGGEVPALPPEKLVPFRGKRAYGSGTLTIDTSPTGAQVILDGTNVQTSPVIFQNIPAGEHQLIFRSDQLGQRDVVLIRLRNHETWQGTWSFIQKRWLTHD